MGMEAAADQQPFRIELHVIPNAVGDLSEAALVGLVGGLVGREPDVTVGPEHRDWPAAELGRDVIEQRLQRSAHAGLVDVPAGGPVLPGAVGTESGVEPEPSGRESANAQYRCASAYAATSARGLSISICVSTRPSSSCSLAAEEPATVR